MSLIQAIILGAIQGVAEFLPVSSSGHLALAAYFFGQADVPLLFDVLLHLSTLAAVIIVFRAPILGLLAVLGRFIVRKSRPDDSDGLKLIVALLIATAVTAVIGFALKDLVDPNTFGPENQKWFYAVVSACLVVTGIILLVSGRYKPKTTQTVPRPLQAVIVGLAQGIGVIPGISRSGSTIAASLFAGIDRKKAGEFSFLLSIPAILAAFMLELKDADTLAGSVSALPLAAGMLSAFLVGLVSLKFLLGLINRGKLGWFAAYLIPAGLGLAAHFSTL